MPPKPQKKKGSWSTIAGEVLLLCAVVALVYWVFAPGENTAFHPVTISDLKGVWTTSHPSYEDRFLQFDDTTITFGWGSAGNGAYAIDTIDCEPGSDGTLVHVRYTDLSATGYRLDFFYMAQNEGALRMKSQEGVYWIRTHEMPIHPSHYQ